MVRNLLSLLTGKVFTVLMSLLVSAQSPDTLCVVVICIAVQRMYRQLVEFESELGADNFLYVAYGLSRCFS